MFNILLYENGIKYFKNKPASFDLILAWFRVYY